MIVKQDLINKIKDYFDLNSYETKVWLALISKGMASAGEVASISGVPRSRTYDVLESLEKRGFAIVKLGKPVKYLGVKPKAVLEKLKTNAVKEAEEKVNVLSKIRETDEFSKLESLYTTGVTPVKRENVSASLKGKSNISGQLREILQNANKEVVICTEAEELASKSRLFKQTFDRLLDSKIKIRAALTGNEKLINELSEKMGIKFQKIELDAKFFIVDRSEILFYVSKEESDEVAIWLNSPFFADAFASLFEKAIEKKK